MEKKNLNKTSTENGQAAAAHMSLDDEQRIKVLSPGMLVLKRFIRNKLAIVGIIIIVAVFIYSFVGGMISRYGETQIFYKTDTMMKNYASATVNSNYYYSVRDGKELKSSAQAAMILAVNKGQTRFTSGGNEFYLRQEGENFYSISELETVATVMYLGGRYNFKMENGYAGGEAFEEAFKAAAGAKQESFDFEGEHYSFTLSVKSYTVSKISNIAIASKSIIDMYSKDTPVTYDFRFAVEKAAGSDEKTFEVGGEKFELAEEEGSAMVYKVDGGTKTEYARMSSLLVTPSSGDVFLTIDFKDAVQEAIDSGAGSIDYTDADGATTHYTIERKDHQFDIKTESTTQLIDTYASPSSEHLLGTDGAGMDLMTRLMYGGRVSLIIGFVVVIIETVLGVILGGISGYFSGWVDNVIMRLVDIFNCIPSLPLYIILGTAMSAMNVPSQTRIFYLMMILGILSWPTVARVVRGQILSLREQEFMLATEATGLSVSRRIFKHLVPNVIPQIIVYATMGLGSVILTEATLSFLGLGVKYPYASWGNIINAVNDSYVLTHFWFVWIPAGFLILITVLGFNFVGDGLRDAFDPKMKR